MCIYQMTPESCESLNLFPFPVVKLLEFDIFLSEVEIVFPCGVRIHVMSKSMLGDIYLKYLIF